ncbi:MAG: TIGR03087 family PEP-CTERM/XrtA system glycosyltransferase [Rhodospirillaceae bacterium]|nr:TIGR03087 family PEP-CTERM/XrtA system glycosyltransferase [Rhodospirillaceae bacterium]
MPDLLFLCHRIPYPPNKGEKIRAYQFIRHLAPHYTVHLGCFIDDVDDHAHEATLAGMVGSLACIRLGSWGRRLNALAGLAGGAPLSVAAFRNRVMSDWVRRTVSRIRPAAAFVYSSAMADYLLEPAYREMPIVMDFVDVDSDKWRQYAQTAAWPASWLYAREARALLAYDGRVARRAAASLFVSRDEAELFKRLCPDVAGKVHAVSNGIDCDYFDPARGGASPYPPGAGPVIVFTGTMDYRPNVDAVAWFARDCLPAIRKRHPNATFAVVGAKPSPEVTALASLAGVMVTGRVDDVRPYIAHANVVVAPLRLARGIQNKVLEGMAMAKPVVTTPQGLEGIEAIAGRDLWVADTAEAIVRSVLSVLADPIIAARAAGARRLMVERYSWAGQLAGLSGIVAAAAKKS